MITTIMVTTPMRMITLPMVDTIITLMGATTITMLQPTWGGRLRSALRLIRPL